MLCYEEIGKLIEKKSANIILFMEKAFQIFQCIERGFQKQYLGGVLLRKVFLEILQISQENTCARVSFLIKLLPEACNFIKNETLAQVFSCEFCVISNNTFFIEHLRWLLLKFSIFFLFNFAPQQILNFLFRFHILKLIASKFRQ